LKQGIAIICKPMKGFPVSGRLFLLAEISLKDIAN